MTVSMPVTVSMTVTVSMPVTVSMTTVAMAAMTMTSKCGGCEGHGSGDGSDYAKIAKHCAFLSSSDWEISANGLHVQRRTAHLVQA